MKQDFIKCHRARRHQKQTTILGTDHKIVLMFKPTGRHKTEKRKKCSLVFFGRLHPWVSQNSMLQAESWIHLINASKNAALLPSSFLLLFYYYFFPNNSGL
jgi:hypothetical protein